MRVPGAAWRDASDTCEAAGQAALHALVERGMNEAEAAMAAETLEERLEDEL
jgi:hypothetical protein